MRQVGVARCVLPSLLLVLCGVGELEAVPSYLTRQVITSPFVAKPTQPYSQAIRVGDTMYVSGQLGSNPAGRLVPGGIIPQTRQALRNLANVLEAGGMGLKNVVKTTVYLIDLENDYAHMNRVYGQYFTENFPSRSSVRAVELPGRARIEIEAIAVDSPFQDLREKAFFR